MKNDEIIEVEIIEETTNTGNGNKEEYKEVDRIFSLPKYFFTGFFIRACAYLVDMLLVGSLIKGLVSSSLGSFDLPQNVMKLIATLFILLYFLLITKFTNGQTLGKMIFGIRVIHEKEEKLSWNTCLIREVFCRFILIKIPVLYLLVFFTKRKQHLGDLLADTSVLTENYLKAQNETN